jgi:hypothetical protein
MAIRGEAVKKKQGPQSQTRSHDPVKERNGDVSATILWSHWQLDGSH